jgi:hypothetical protein
MHNHEASSSSDEEGDEDMATDQIAAMLLEAEGLTTGLQIDPEVQREQEIKKQEIHIQSLKQEAQYDRGLADASIKNLAMAKQALLVKEGEIKGKESSLLSREAKVDEAISYITSVFKTIEKLKV